jgi:transcriptional regulator with PAS, ATPase and Fis domain
MGIENVIFSPEFMEKLKKYQWPGNVRELQGVIEREILHLEAGKRVINHIPDFMLKEKEIKGEKILETLVDDEVVSLSKLEKMMIKRAFKRFGGNRRKMCEALDISRTTLFRKMKEYKIE